MAAEVEGDSRVLALFEGSGTIDSPTPGVRVWLARDFDGERRAVMVKRVTIARKARANEALHLVYPSIVRTRRWLAEGGYLYVVRDVVKGKNLRQTLLGLGGARPTPELLRKILTPVLDALVYAHGQGLPHGGISPDNILIADDGGIWVSDFATADPAVSPHFAVYNGNATVLGDVKALGRVMSAYLPTAGALASPALRGKMEGIISRCDTLTDLRETLNALERMAVAPNPSAAVPSGPAAASRPAAAASRPGPPPLQATPPVSRPAGTALLVLNLAERPARIPQGGGAFAALTARNEGSAPLVIRMVATQHSWLNLREPEMPLTLSPGGVERIGFSVSAARLTPGEYRSEVYLLANAGGPAAEDQKTGWFKHTAEITITVESPMGPMSPRGNRAF